MRFKLPAIFLFLLVCTLPPLVRADKDTTELTIVVLDAARERPVPKASITVSFISGRKMLIKKVRSEWNTKTNTKGFAELPEMPSGKVRLQVIAAGFRTHGEVFEVEGETMTHTVRLKRPRDQYSAHDEAEPEPEPEQKPEAKPEDKPKPN